MDLIQEYSDSSENEYTARTPPNNSNLGKRKRSHGADTSLLVTEKISKGFASADVEREKSPYRVRIKLLESPRASAGSCNGRKRNKKHVQGNWAGHVFLKIPCNSGCGENQNEEMLYRSIVSTLRWFQCRMNLQVRSSPYTTESIEEVPIVPHVSSRDLENICSSDSDSERKSSQSASDEASSASENELHISLSRQFFLQKQSLNPFLSHLKQRIQAGSQRSIHVHVPTLALNDEDKNLRACPFGDSHQGQRITDMEILSNDEQTRSFLTIPVITPGSEITSLVKIVDSTMRKFGVKEYYDDPKFHISIASWKYSEKLIERWEYLKLHPTLFDSSTQRSSGIFLKGDSNADGGKAASRADPLVFAIRGIYCDFGTVEKHYIPFEK